MTHLRPQSQPITPLFWLWIPLIWMTGQLAAEAYFPAAALIEFHSEGGLHEWLQFVMLIGVFILACHIFWVMDRRTHKGLTLWIALAALGSFYVAGEEISWGQWIMGWATPEGWQAINYQNETNLHNISRWFNQKPRLLLEIGVIAGGTLIPLLLWLRPHWIPQKLIIILPPAVLAPTALIYIAAKFSQKISKMHFDTRIFQRASEVEELYLYFFVLLYMIILRARILGSKT